MHSVTLDSSGSPKKRTFSRGLSEDESLRSIIKETESSSRRLARSDSRAGTLKKRTDSQSDQDLFMGLPEMLELQASYDEAVQELRGLEVEREALLFQVDVLQDTLEGVEELLAEAQREAGQASSELEQEKGAKRKLESLVSSLMQEVERLKEERDTNPTPPVNMTNEEAKQEQMSDHVAEEKEKDTLLCETCHRENSSGGLAAAKNGEPGAEDAGSTPTKLQRMVSQPLDQLPSLSVGDPAPKDGVFQRPYENCTVDGKDQSPDTNDSDSISAYEDASADTPEHDRIFPGDDDLPDDSENKEENPTSSCQGNEGETKNPESCIMS
ncbi:uncharacterized protein PAE49_003018 isoform 2-T2 [Odontesthes bonariensis]|uniref:uncharacterized protein LOC142377065 isoform X2 n=1 Tax=Odontesthes bonariensis TaxID=219752 RepID=UPI003F5851C6